MSEREQPTESETIEKKCPKCGSQQVRWLEVGHTTGTERGYQPMKWTYECAKCSYEFDYIHLNRSGDPEGSLVCSHD